ncbi:MAG: 1-acyl-sn-glycerol-3-phosphate acyltransferase, partial [Myxococcales bacterium]|nr:1-acyl-sn-glycerol-3-phosphate acyltransferase [Myxococcales bacterium]
HRLERTRGREAEQLADWQRLARRIGRMTADELRDEVERRARDYVVDVVGHFDRRVYRFATSVLPVGLGALFNTTDLARGFNSMRDLSTRIRVDGDLETLRRLADRGTLVVVPTHSSNLDSIVLGWSLLHAGLPPATYGAGKNLFSNPLIGYFMRNLGAYRVDRRLRHVLYKDVLKIYSEVIIERGYHSLFFPGGTRSRSGLVEQKLKLGLLGSALAAFSERLQRGDDRPIYIVPVTINYPLVLEAETLIEDHLKASGQARYIIDDDEFSRIGRIVQYAVQVMGLESTMVIRYGQCLDVFGNKVGPDGRSHGPDGTVIDPARYFYRDGRPVADAARDAEYTRQAGAEVGAAFLRETVILPTQFLGWLLFERERRTAPHLDLFALLRTTSNDRHDLTELCSDAERVRARLVKMEAAGQVHLDATVRHGPIDEVIEGAVRTFGMYHLRSAVERADGALIVRDPKLLFFYGNRLAGWAGTLRGELS